MTPNYPLGVWLRMTKGEYKARVSGHLSPTIAETEKDSAIQI